MSQSFDLKLGNVHQLKVRSGAETDAACHPGNRPKDGRWHQRLLMWCEECGLAAKFIGTHQEVIGPLVALDHFSCLLLS